MKNRTIWIIISATILAVFITEIILIYGLGFNSRDNVFSIILANITIVVGFVIFYIQNKNKKEEEKKQKDPPSKLKDSEEKIPRSADVKQNLEEHKDSSQLYEIPLKTERLRKAKEPFDEGKYIEADEVLNETDISFEIKQRKAAIERKEQETAQLYADLENNSNKFLLKAQLWTTRYSEQNWQQQAIKYFKAALEASRTTEALFQYAYFLWKQYQFQEAIPLYEEALGIYRQLAKNNPDAYLHYIAMTLNNLGILHRTINDYPKALEEYEEALGIYRQLAKNNLTLTCLK